MRYTLRAAIQERHKWSLRENLAAWWLEWPPRRKAFWRELLLAEGSGWLRWGVVRDTRIVGYDPGEPDDYMYAPPLRRLAWYLKWWSVVPYRMFVGWKNDDGTRTRLSWSEARPSFDDLTCPDWGVDKDRHRNLWGATR